MSIAHPYECWDNEVLPVAGRQLKDADTLHLLMFQ